MENENAKPGLLTRLFGAYEVNTNVGFTQADLIKIGAALFIVACLIFIAWFTFKKVLN